MRTLIIIFISTILFIAATIANLLISQPAFNYNLQLVPKLQTSTVLNTDQFKILMNIVSNVFNPILCAGYVFAVYLLVSRKLEIIVFLLWFIGLSVGLSFMKMLIHQPRPFWIAQTRIEMLEWICYTEYGCPSGHSMLGLVLIEYLIRFAIRNLGCRKMCVMLMYVCGGVLQSLVCFSRIYLGMHSINQVLFGVMLGLYSLVVYYHYAEVAILKVCMAVCHPPNRKCTVMIVSVLMMVGSALAFIAAFVPHFDNEKYLEKIISISKCKDTEIYSSFQYRCLKDSALIMAAWGILYGLLIAPFPHNLMKPLIYHRTSAKFLSKTLITLIMALVPIIIFMNPLWKKIQLTDSPKSILIWLLHALGLLFGTFVLIGITPHITHKLGLQKYHAYRHPELPTDPIILNEMSSQYSRHNHSSIIIPVQYQ